ncbi:tyrosine-type recombinase/integrase [Novosphingobium sp. Leaf2]|uniref:tyrosine-type recombinase/integrase n=1 Tax=Novosphingobium sp. Leaf2 TaxID=1735670 RepID=UPI0006F462D3|nr:tyrosine-type recombinase/integrase [Novosphingobium sp. Leaf2]KQM20852.1 transposase [Novosphingobium sp. Leaf2]
MVSIVRAGTGERGIPASFPILFDAKMAIIEPAFVWLIEHAELSGHAQASETVRTYGEHLHDWFDALEQSGIEWREADERVIAAYRNRMLEQPSSHTGRPYARTTINARVSTVCRFYGWALDRGLIDHCPFRLTEKMTLMLNGAYRPGLQRRQVNALIVSRPERLPRPLRADELAGLFAHLRSTARLAAQWALGAGLRRKELCALAVDQIPDSWPLGLASDPLVGVPLHITKGDRPRTVYPPLRLLDHTHWYIGEDRARIVRRARRANRGYRAPSNLLLNQHGRAMTRTLLTAQFAEAFAASGLHGTLHWLRHTFAMAMLARLQVQVRTNPDLNPLKVVQVLLGHASIATTAIYLRCVELHERDLSESLAYLYGELIPADG